MDFRYKHSRVKQYLKEGRALRIETVINKPYHIGVLARLEHLPELITKCRAVNRRLLMIERAGQGCAIVEAEATQVVGHLVGRVLAPEQPGDQPAKACVGEAGDGVDEHGEGTGQGHGAWVPEAQGSGSLALPYVGLVDALEQRRADGLIERIPKTNTYTLTADGLRVAVFYTKLYGRLLRPLVAAADQPPAPIQLRRAMATIDHVIADYVDNARLGAAA